eukprot:Pompholyxophrys_punicea_v1_NODE_174_length_3018_cov_13.585893.p3 type:complete len:116 gc:universal NODE_174_length_3018_cov_13.585893:2180-1833(-)
MTILAGARRIQTAQLPFAQQCHKKMKGIMRANNHNNHICEALCFPSFVFSSFKYSRLIGVGRETASSPKSNADIRAFSVSMDNKPRSMITNLSRILTCRPRPPSNMRCIKSNGSI